MSLVFQQPPPIFRGRAGTQAAVAARQLRERPGEWAVYRTYDGTRHGQQRAAATAYSIRTAYSGSWSPAGAFEATGWKVDDEHRVYVRFVGQEPTAAAEVMPEPAPEPEPVRAPVRVTFDQAQLSHLAHHHDGRVHTLCGRSAPEKVLANTLRRGLCQACWKAQSAPS